MASPAQHPLETSRDAVSGRPAVAVLDAIARAARACDRALIFGHAHPDGDALGSQAALALGLRALGKDARAVCAPGVPETLLPLLPGGAVEIVEAPERLPWADLCFLLDATDPERAGPFRDAVLAPGRKRIVIDHHPFRDEPHLDEHLVVPESPSVGNLILALLDRLAVPVEGWIAQALWIALASDTGWFRFANATPWAFLDAARLVAKGLDTENLYRVLYAELSPPRARVLGTMLAGLRCELGGRLVWSTLRREAYVREGIGVGDLDGFIDALKGVRGAEVIALVVETESDRFKVSLRAPGDGDVERVARSLGGGGHRKAAGFRFSGRFEELAGLLVRRIEEVALEGAAEPW